MKARHAAAIATFTLVACVVAYQAATARPPEPYVRLVGDGRPSAPWIQTECRQGEIVRVYRSDAAETAIDETGVAC